MDEQPVQLPDSPPVVPTVNLGGRPSSFTQEIADEVCRQLAEGKSMRKVCKAENMPDMTTIFRWLRTNDKFCQQYVKAKEESTDALHEDLTELGDEAIELAQTVDSKASNAVVQAVKLKSDNLKWVMSKLKPKKYGDKVDMTTNGKDLPTPLLHVLHNKGNTEDIQPEETH